MTVLGPIAQFSLPDVTGRDRSPQLANELLLVIARVDDAVIMTEELLARVAGNLAERVIDVADAAGHVSDRDDRRVVERALEVRELTAGRTIILAMLAVRRGPLRDGASHTSQGPGQRGLIRGHG